MTASDDQRDTNNITTTSPEVNHVHEPQSEQQLSTPPGELNDAKTSRKREREVSLEPATPQATSQEADSDRPEGKERRTPAKKNRTSDIVLETPQEEAEDNEPASGSPPHETKIREISQGVEDITWQNMKKDDVTVATLNEQRMDEDVPVPSPDQEAADAQPETQETPTGQSTPSEATQEASAPALVLGPNPPIVSDVAGEDEDTGAAAGAEQPPDSHVAGAPQPSVEPISSSPSASAPVSASSSEAQLSTSQRLPATHRRDSDSDQEKGGLKRKLGDRTVSESRVPGETASGHNGALTIGATKRPRDDPDADPNTREKKRPTPPPEEDEKPAEKKAEATHVTNPQTSGFMAYASTSSPFASVQGPRIFGGKQPSTSPWASGTSGGPFGTSGATSPFASGSTSPSPFAAAVAAKEASSAASSPPQAHKRTGFEAFASSASPFASAAKRPKSPPPPSNILGRSRSPSRHGTPARATNAFSAYALGGAQGFAAPTPKRAGGSVFGESSSGTPLGGPNSAQDSGKEDEDSEKDSGVSFGERLRASKDKEEEEISDEEKRLNLTEQEVMTGEEEEETVYQVRGKLYALSSQNQWKERGTGMLRLNVKREDGTGARLIMRKEAVYTVLLNATLFKGMRCFLAQDPRYIRFSVFETGVTTHYNLRVSNAKIAEELLEEINAHIPTE